MTRQLRIEFPGALWHITSRGNERRDIIRDPSDCRRFVSQLAEVATVRRWVLHAWVLMSNHYHLLVETPEVGLSRGVKSLNQEYASWFNHRHDRVGHLFQGRFKGILVEREAHLLELVRYVVLNPVRAGMVRSAGDYEWSSYRATAGLEPVPPWLEVEWTLRRFAHDPLGAPEAYRQFVAARVSYRPWESLLGQIYLGDEAFRERMQERAGGQGRSLEHPRVQREGANIPKVRSLVLAEFGEEEAELRRRRHRQARKAFAQLAGEAGCSLVEIGQAIGATKYGVWKMRRGGEDLYASDDGYRERIDRIRAQLKS